MIQNLEKQTYLKQLHQKGLSLFPIESNSKIPLLVKRKLNIDNPFITVRSNEKVIDGKVDREWRMRRKRFINKPMSWQTIKKYLDQDCNFALLTGQQYNGGYICILDFDLKGEKVKEKWELFGKWLSNHSDFESYPMHETPSGGYQFPFISPYPIKKQNMYLNGIHIGEVLADGAYGLLPYSIIDGKPYQSINSLIDNDLPVIDINKLSIDFYINNCYSYCEHDSTENHYNSNYVITVRWSKENYYKKLIQNNYNKIMTSQVGNRNNELYQQTRLAFAVAREFKFDTEEIETFKEAALLAGLEPNEIEATFESAKNAYFTIEVTFKRSLIKKVWDNREEYKEELGNSLEAFEWFRTHICRTTRGKGVLQEEFKQGFLSSTTGQEKLGNLLGVSRHRIGRWIKDWINKGWCEKIVTDDGWCYRFGEIIGGVLHWFIDTVYSLEVPQLKTPFTSIKIQSFFIVENLILEPD